MAVWKTVILAEIANLFDTYVHTSVVCLQMKILIIYYLWAANVLELPLVIFPVIGN